MIIVTVPSKIDHLAAKQTFHVLNESTSLELCTEELRSNKMAAMNFTSLRQLASLTFYVVPVYAECSQRSEGMRDVAGLPR